MKKIIEFFKDKEKIKYNSPVFVCIIAIIVLLVIPTGYEGAAIYKESEHCQGKVISVDNSAIVDIGIIRTGEQSCTINVTSGMFKGKTVEGVNLLSGSMQKDKIFNIGDKAQILISHNGDEILTTSMVDHFRVDKEIILAIAFMLFLIGFAGKTGLRAVISFVLSVLMIWKVLVPVYLNGVNPVWVGIAVTIALTVLIIALVYGFDRRSISAISGAVAGVIVTCFLGVIFTDLFKIHGAIMTDSESLLYSGFSDLNLTKIFMASIFIASSGAIMDLAVDITSAVYEVIQKKPDITFKEATISGFNVGRNAMGTMTTTLLLAYSGGYITLLMVFMAQGTPIDNVLNYKYVSAEIIHTIVGSFGLCTVAPLTAVTSGYFLTKRTAK